MNERDTQRLAELFPEQAAAILAKPKHTELSKEAAKVKREALERLFLATWRLRSQVLKMRGESLLEPEEQYKFDHERGYRFDFAWPSQMLAVEIHGGQWVNGGHNRGVGMQRDVEKKRLAISQGWRVLEYTTDDMKDPVKVIKEVENILKGLAQ